MGRALAYAGIADCYVLLSVYRSLSANEAYPKAKAAVLQTLQIDEQLAEAHTSLAMTYLLSDWNWPSAEKGFRRAIELNPNYATAHHWYALFYLAYQARFDEAIAEVKRALALDPLSLSIHNSLGIVYDYARYSDLAIEQLLKTIEMDQNFYVTYYHLGLAYLTKGELSKGIEQAMRLNDDPENLAAIGYANGILGNHEAAKKTIAQLKKLSGKRIVSPFDFAKIYAGLGDKEKAFELLQQGIEQHDGSLLVLKVEAFWDNLRDDARFIELLNKVGLE